MTEACGSGFTREEAGTGRHKKTGHKGRFFHARGNYSLPAFSLR